MEVFRIAVTFRRALSRDVYAPSKGSYDLVCTVGRINSFSEARHEPFNIAN